MPLVVPHSAILRHPQQIHHARRHHPSSQVCLLDCEDFEHKNLLSANLHYCHRFLILELVVACHYLDYTQAFRVFGETSADHSQHYGQDSDRTKENLITYVDGAEAIGMPAKLELSDGKRKESTQQKASPTVINRKGSEEYEKHHKI